MNKVIALRRVSALGSRGRRRRRLLRKAAEVSERKYQRRHTGRTSLVAAATLPESAATAGEPADVGVTGSGPASAEGEHTTEAAGEDIG
jgi:hypothetical protein